MSDDAHDIGAEQSLLGSVLKAPAEAGPALLAVQEDAWWLPRHATIAAVLTARLRRNQPIDPQVVLTDLLARKFGSEAGPYLMTLMEHAWTPGKADIYADRVIQCAARRNLAKALTRSRQQLEESWRLGATDPITDITKELREQVEYAEQSDAGVQADVPSQTVTELLAGRDEYNWLVPGLLERGERIVLTGSEGLGKSWLISQFAACLAAGRHPFTGSPLGKAGTYEQQVLIVDCENGVSQSRRRFQGIASRVAGQDRAWLDNMRIELRPDGLNLLGQDAGWLERRIAMNTPDLLVLGPLYRLHFANMNDETAARDLVRILDGLRTRYGFALLTEAHPGHAEDGAGERRMRPAGSSLFLRWPEFGFGLRRAKEAQGEHPNLVDVVAWRGSREQRSWPKQLKHGSTLPWEPAHSDYYQEAAA